MDKIKEKLTNLRNEADKAIERAEEAEAKVKQLEQTLLERDQENASLTHRLGVAESEIEKLDDMVTKLKGQVANNDSAGSTNDGLMRKVALLEEELDASERNLKETVEKLRQVDIKAEGFERQVQRLEQEKDRLEVQLEVQVGEHKKTKAELDELVSSMEGL